MARYKPVCYEQDKFIPISFSKQILPGTFEFTMDYVVDNELDLSTFDERYNNDITGCAAYDPAVLLKIVLYAYSRGIISSRKIAQACDENVIFVALSADTRPHFTTIASFIANMAEQIQPLFSDVLLYCDELGLIGKEMFAIDGCKLSSNASKEWSGTKAELEAKRKKLNRAVDRMLKSLNTLTITLRPRTRPSIRPKPSRPCVGRLQSSRVGWTAMTKSWAREASLSRAMLRITKARK